MALRGPVRSAIAETALLRIRARAKFQDADRMLFDRAGLEQATEQLEYTTIRAPYSGIVTQRHGEVGEVASPGEPVMSAEVRDRLHAGWCAAVENAGATSLVGPGLLLLLDGVVDPRNLGAILRSGTAAGVDGVLLGGAGSVGLTPAVAKVSAGAIERIPVAREPRPADRLRALREGGFRALALDLEEDADLPPEAEREFVVHWIDTTLRENRDLRVAIARIDEAAATVGIVRADLFPRVNYGGGGFVDGLIESASNPLLGLFVGILVTTLVQSSSTTTSASGADGKVSAASGAPANAVRLAFPRYCGHPSPDT